MSILFGRTMKSALLAMALGLGAAAPASAIDPQPINPRITLSPGNPAIDLQALQNQQRRLDFQNQQQRFRQDDRDANARQRLDLTVPKLRQACRTEVFGNRYVTNCK